MNINLQIQQTFVFYDVDSKEEHHLIRYTCDEEKLTPREEMRFRALMLSFFPTQMNMSGGDGVVEEVYKSKMISCNLYDNPPEYNQDTRNWTHSWNVIYKTARDE